ncbi:hypothetical protein PIB30_002666 [Stylosanthes scabra]|uniref:MATH domain-containing protein n=1 Tax=Stylosanthes scabra TaxID=79078 RepID=A0ABU6Q3Y3_9FABA|nr:hypothetical protein [Stylosanthes scabra]
MENYQQGKEIEKFTWVIESFSKKNTKKLRSKSFQVGGCKWQIHVHPIEKGVDYLSLYLKLGGSVPSLWSKYVYFSFALINHMNPQKSVVKETQQKFNSGYRSWGSKFVALNDFYDPKQGYLLNNVCIIEARICVSDVAFDTNIFNNNNNNGSSSSTHHSNHQTSNETLSRSTSTTTQDEDVNGRTTLQPDSDDVVLHYVPTAPPLLYPTIICDHEPLVVPLVTTTLSEILDVKSLAEEEQAFVPLLEEVCSWHPSLIQSQMKKSPKFIQWAFIALGQVLHFLKTTKVKDMDEKAFNKLHCLWEELQLFGFELSWLEPHVESALGMKGYLERVKTLKENVIGLEMEMKMLRAKMAVTEIDLELAKRDLAEVQMGFEDKDMDKELGYGYGYGYA